MEENRKKIEELNIENLSNQILKILLNNKRNGKTPPTLQSLYGLLAMHFADVTAQAPITQELKFERLNEIEKILPEAFKIAVTKLELGQDMSLAELKLHKSLLLDELNDLKEELNELQKNQEYVQL